MPGPMKWDACKTWRSIAFVPCSRNGAMATDDVFRGLAGVAVEFDSTLVKRSREGAIGLRSITSSRWIHEKSKEDVVSAGAGGGVAGPPLVGCRCATGGNARSATEGVGDPVAAGAGANRLVRASGAHG